PIMVGGIGSERFGWLFVAEHGIRIQVARGPGSDKRGAYGGGVLRVVATYRSVKNVAKDLKPLARVYEPTAGIDLLDLSGGMVKRAGNLVQRKRNTFHYRAGEVPLFVAYGDAEEGAANPAIPYWCAFARQVGKKDQSF